MMTKTIFVKNFPSPFSEKKVEMTKKEQLKVAFKALITDMLHRIVGNLNDSDDVIAIEETANLMVKEVTIRTVLK